MGARPLPPGGREGARGEGPRLPEPPGRHDRKADLHQAAAAGGGGRAVVWIGGAVQVTARPLAFQPCKGRGRRAWGFNPRDERPLFSESPERAQAAPPVRCPACAPFGASGCVGSPVLGLKPQALRPRPLRG